MIPLRRACRIITYVFLVAVPSISQSMQLRNVVPNPPSNPKRVFSLALVLHQQHVVMKMLRAELLSDLELIWSVQKRESMKEQNPYEMATLAETTQVIRFSIIPRSVEQAAVIMANSDLIKKYPLDESDLTRIVTLYRDPNPAASELGKFLFYGKYLFEINDSRNTRLLNELADKISDATQKIASSGMEQNIRELLEPFFTIFTALSQYAGTEVSQQEYFTARKLPLTAYLEKQNNLLSLYHQATDLFKKKPEWRKQLSAQDIPFRLSPIEPLPAEPVPPANANALEQAIVETAPEQEEEESYLSEHLRRAGKKQSPRPKGKQKKKKGRQRPLSRRQKQIEEEAAPTPLPKPTPEAISPEEADMRWYNDPANFSSPDGSRVIKNNRLTITVEEPIDGVQLTIAKGGIDNGRGNPHPFELHERVKQYYRKRWQQLRDEGKPAEDITRHRPPRMTEALIKRYGRTSTFIDQQGIQIPTWAAVAKIKRAPDVIEGLITYGFDPDNPNKCYHVFLTRRPFNNIMQDYFTDTQWQLSWQDDVQATA